MFETMKAIMMSNATRNAHGQDDGRRLPYRSVGNGWSAWSGAVVGGGVYTDAHGTEADDVFTGTDAGERFLGLGGDDTIDGNGGDDNLFGGEGDDIINGGTGRDHLSGDDGNDIINGDDGNDVIEESGIGQDVIYGGRGNDVIIEGGDGGDILHGNKGDDQLLAILSTMFGEGGNDYLQGQGSEMHGGAGSDRLEISDPFAKDGYSHDVWGGSGADTFVFITPFGEYIGGGHEVIHDLSSEDTIDLSRVDASDRVAGDQEFNLVGAFDGHAKEMTVRYDAENDQTLIELYTNKDMQPDGTILIAGDHTDFVNFVF